VNTPPNLFKSTNGGTSFTNIKAGLPDRFVMDFEISPKSDDSVWIVLGGFGTSHVYVTGNGGVTWTSKGNGLPDVPTNAVALDPLNPSVIYVGNDIGVYMSPDYGNTWFDFNRGLWDATQIMDLIVTKNRKLVAATHGKGVFISDLFAANLPVTLVSFTGFNRGDINRLEWSTATEENSDHFELQRSYGGADFTTIATIQSKNSANGANYMYDDNISTIKDAEVIFYRLRMVDKDGSFDYSNVVSIHMPLKTNFIVKGNPFTDVIKMQLTTSKRENLQLNLYDASGKLMAMKSMTVAAGINELQWDGLSTLASGNYLLELRTSSDRLVQKLFKK
jgi:hypothetical protein